MHFVLGNSGGCFETCRFLCSSMHTCLLYTHSQKAVDLLCKIVLSRRDKYWTASEEPGEDKRPHQERWEPNSHLFFMENPVQTAEDGEGPHRTLRERCGKPEVQSFKCI